MAKRVLKESTKRKLRMAGKRRASDPRVKACIRKLRMPDYLDRLARLPFAQGRKMRARALGRCMALGVKK